MKKQAQPTQRREKKAAPLSKKTLPPQAAQKPDADTPFPIVGIGSSAGGLEALEMFLKNMPANSGIAFVIIQHLDPTHKGIMVELLQRATMMPVVQATDRMKVAPDCVYVIPPHYDLSILHGVLHLLEPTAPRGLRLPIDLFLRSLADDRKGRSIGVILSGMGSDGTLGLRAIRERTGAGFVQSPASAKFDSMPKSAIDAGLADVIAPVEELPHRIIAYLHHAKVNDRQDSQLEEKAQSALEKIFILIRTQTGHDFSLYKKNTIYRRVERRMGLHQIDRIATYIRFLQENPKETELLFRELLIGVTSFFRDPAAWKQMQEKLIPEGLAAHPKGRIFRAWTPGCSTGEEAYSLAIVFKEALDQAKPTANFSLQIFATDLDKDAIDRARAGLYPPNIAADVTPERLSRFFVQEAGGFRIGKEIRETVIFAPQNLVMDPPFTKIDILICRNLLIYLTPELQKKLMPLFHYSLNPGGILFLGSAETVGPFSDGFKMLDGKTRLFRRLASLPGAEPIEFPATFFPAPRRPLLPAAEKKEIPNIQALVDRLLLAQYAPAAVLTNDRGDILLISGRTGKYLEPAAGKANWNLFVMAREGLRYELTAAFPKALRERDFVTLKGLRVKNNGGMQGVDITIQTIIEPEALHGMVLTVFVEAPLPPEKAAPGRRSRGVATNALVEKLEQELKHAREDLQSSREEMQSSQEELKSMNEELQSTNEELQSTSEEQITSKEEMQSMNEELQTVNQELQAKLSDFTRMNSDMKNLLDSTEIATLFLDNELRVRRFSARVSQIIKLIPGDVGRPVTDIASDLRYSELGADAREVLRTLVFAERQSPTHDGRWFSVRIMPYRTLDNRIDGVVVTFTDITVSKRLEGELRKTQAGLEKRLSQDPAAPA